MLFKKVDKEKILNLVEKSVGQAKSEIVVTMLLCEEINHPLPSVYFNLLKKKVEDGITLKRLGFGRKEDYNKIKQKIGIKRKNYIFKYISGESQYQRLLIIDRKKLYFGINGLFFQGNYRPLIGVFLDYFNQYFRKGKI